jgi:predicted nucleotidyltransferase
VHSALKVILKNESDIFRRYTLKELRHLFSFRCKDTIVSFEDFVPTESRKTLQGKFHGRDYFIRCVKDWNEVNEKYGDVQYENVGYAKIKATVVDDSESIFTPCTYKLEKTTIVEGASPESISEIVSFRGRFCEQAVTGETVVAQGKVEKVYDNRTDRKHFRLLIGNKPSDFMILKH